MMPDGEPRDKWLAGLTPMDAYNVKHLLALFAVLGIPEGFMDAGCGTGIMVRTAQKLGVRAYGIDQLVEEDKWGNGFYCANLVNPFLLPRPVDLVLSIEVAEHIHETAHATFCDTLTRNLKEESGSHLIFSAARPGQAGTGHIACRPAEYWHKEFILRGLSYNAYLTLHLAHVFSIINSPLNYYWDNLIVFSR